jgi:hypothetical protein
MIETLAEGELREIMSITRTKPERECQQTSRLDFPPWTTTIAGLTKDLSPTPLIAPTDSKTQW